MFRAIQFLGWRTLHEAVQAGFDPTGMLVTLVILGAGRVLWILNPTRRRGFMTFIVGQDEVSYQKVSCPEEKQLAESMVAFDPDSTWGQAESE